VDVYRQIVVNPKQTFGLRVTFMERRAKSKQ